MKLFNLFFSCLLLSSIHLKAQYNLVPNSGFEEGNQFGQEPRCFHYSEHGSMPWVTKGRARDFSKDIAYWENALYTPDRFDDYASSNWIGDNCYEDPDGKPCFYSTTSKRCCYVGPTEGVLVALKKDGVSYRLKGGQTYTFRIKFFAKDNGYKVLNIKFATWGEHWNSKKKGNTRFNDAGKIDDRDMITKYGCNWVSYSKTFTVPEDMDNKLGYLILLTELGPGYEGIWMDDVELYEGDCSTDLRVENKTYASVQTAPYEHQTIYAGYDAGDPTTSGNVIATSTANFSYKGARSVQLLPGFKTEPGAVFKGFIGPCNRICFFPKAYAGENTELCSPNQTLQLGFSTLGPDNSSYVWTAEPSSALSYLSSTTIHNPVFTGPSSGIGVIRYTQKATNSCGEVATSDVTIHYDTQPSASPSVGVSNINMSSPLQFDVNCNVHTETVKMEILDMNSNVLQTYLLQKNEDFTTIPFHWTLPDYFSFCSNYMVRVSSKNYCYSNWSTPNTFTWYLPNQTLVLGPPTNIFTPNGDGVGDLLCFSGITGLVEYTISVFDRDGVRVHYEHNVPVYGASTVCMWDGRCSEGFPNCWNHKILPDAYYGITIQYVGCNVTTGYNGYVHLSKESLSQPNGIAEEKSIENVGRSLFPNPTTGAFTIETIGNIKAIEVTDALGRIVHAEKVSGSKITVALENVNAGIYFVRTTLEDDTSFMDKIYISDENK